MVLLKVKVVKGMSCIRMIEKAFEDYTKVKNPKLSEFLTSEVASKLLNINPEYLKATLINSKTLHGIEYPDKIIVHKKGVFSFIGTKFKNFLSKELKRSSYPRQKYQKLPQVD